MLGDGTCQAACYTEACNWDKTDCSSEFCSPLCSPTLQFNAQCDQECNSALCNYDEGNCLVCSSGCCDKIGNCEADCLVPENGYDIGCADDFKRDTAKFFQTYFEDFSLVTGADTCYSKDDNCSEAKLRELYAGTGTDATACKSESCLNQLGHGQDCAADCNRCNGSKCLECKDTYYQHYSTCVTTCPSGFIEHPKVPKLCYPSDDIESLAVNIFISTTQTGTNYYTSLTNAFISNSSRKIAVYYLTDAITEVRTINYPSSAKTLKITTNLCSLNLNTPCLTNKATIRLMKSDAEQFSVGSSKLVIENVDGYYSINNSCAEDSCSYNPYYLQIGSVYIDDRDNRNTSWSGGYSWRASSESRLIEAGCNSSLILINVGFYSLRVNQKSIMTVGGRLHMTGVTFRNVNTHWEWRFIIDQKCECEKQCDFKYVGGSVELLNNGFEYRDNLSQRGFIQLENSDSVIIKDIEIRSNIVIGLNLIDLTVIKGHTTIENCTFKSNVLTAYVINIDNRNLVLSSQTADNKDRILDETTQVHIIIKNCVFSDISSLALIRVLIGTQMRNVLLEGLVIEHSVAKESLINITRPTVPSVIDVEGGYEIKTLEGTQGGTGVKLLARNSRLSAITINNSNWGQYAFELVNLVNLTIDKVHISQSGSFEGDINLFAAKALIDDPKVYLSRPVDFGYNSAPCLAGISVQGTYGLSVSRIELTDMKCQGCAGLAANQIFKNVVVKDFKAVRVESSSSQAALISLTEIEGTVTISGVNVDTVTNLSGSGVVYSRLTTLTLTDSTFKNVIASQSPGLYPNTMKSITLTNVVFQSLQSTSGLGAGIQASFDSRVGVSLNLKSSNIADCRASASKGGGVALTYSTNPLEFLLDDCEFSSNYANSGGSSLYIESTVVFTAN
jgi:hypothetical protein